MSHGMDRGNGLGRVLVFDDGPRLNLRRVGGGRYLVDLSLPAANIAHGQKLALALRLPEIHPADALAGLDSGTLIAGPGHPYRAGSGVPFG